MLSWPACAIHENACKCIHHRRWHEVCVFIHIHIHAVLCMLYVVDTHTIPCEIQYTAHIIVSYTASMRMHCMEMMPVLLCNMLCTVHCITAQRIVYVYSYIYIYMLYCVCCTLYHTIRCHVDVVITGIHSTHHSLIHSIHENALYRDYACIAMQHVMYSALHHCTEDSVCVFIHIHIHAVLCMLYVVSYHTMSCRCSDHRYS